MGISPGEAEKFVALRAKLKNSSLSGLSPIEACVYAAPVNPPMILENTVDERMSSTYTVRVLSFKAAWLVVVIILI